MRSVVVVLPASIWAIMPILRYRSRGYWRGIQNTYYHSVKSHNRKFVLTYALKWEKARFASAILWVSSRLRMAAPVLLDASINSPANFSENDFPDRAIAPCKIQRDAKAKRR